MAVRDAPPQPAPAPEQHRETPYPAQKARGGEIILRTRTRRMIFFGGLIGAVLLALVLTLFA